MKKDKAIDELRSVRQVISKEHDHDARRLLEYYKKLEKKYAKQMLADSGDCKKTAA